MIKFFKYFSDYINSKRPVGYDYLVKVEEKLKLLKNKNIKVLEVGCNNRPIIDKNIYKNIILHGIDPDDSIILKNVKNKFDKFTITSLEDIEVSEKYDLIIIDCVLEHVKNNNLIFKKLSKLILDDGIIITNQPSNLHPFSIINRILSHNTKTYILKTLRPWSKVGLITGWKSYYHNCNIQGFKKLCKKNNLIIDKGYFNYNASDYFTFFPPLFLFIVVYEETIKLFGLKLLCSNFCIEIKKQP